MTAAVYNITCEQGADLRIVFTATDSNGAAIDLTGASAAMQVRATVAAAATILSLTSAVGGGIELGGVAGTITITVLAAITAGLQAGAEYVYDLRITFATTAVDRFVQGNFDVSPAVTR